MSFSFGGSASHTATVTNKNANSTTTPIVPEWAGNLIQGAAGRVNSLLGVDPQSLVAPVHDLQAQAGRGAANLSGSPWNYDAAASLTGSAANTSWLDGYTAMPTPFASGGKASDYVGNYLNPYLRNVVDATSADLDTHDGQVRAQQALSLAGSGAFGGSGAALTQSMTEGELARARATTLGGLRSQAYDTALTAAGGDAERATQARMANAQTALQDRAQKVGWNFQSQQQQLAAANQIAGISGAYDANQRANIDSQARLGATLRGIETEQRQAPFTSSQQIVAMLSGLPISLFTGQQTQSTEKVTGSQDKFEAHAGIEGPFKK